jgi:hypothetical protein
MITLLDDVSLWRCQLRQGQTQRLAGRPAFRCVEFPLQGSLPLKNSLVIRWVAVLLLDLLLALILQNVLCHLFHHPKLSLTATMSEEPKRPGRTSMEGMIWNGA